MCCISGTTVVYIYKKHICVYDRTAMCVMPNTVLCISKITGCACKTQIAVYKTYSLLRV